MSKFEQLKHRIRKLEKLLIRETAKNSHLEEQNKRLADGSLAEYYKNQCIHLDKENVSLKNEIIIMKIKEEK